MDYQLMTNTEANTRAVTLYPDRQLTLVRGEGAYLFDDTGQRYLDMMNNYGLNIIGHSHPDIVAAITNQAGQLSNLHQTFHSPVRDEFLTTLGGLLDLSLERIIFANTGAETVEVALKFARLATGRSNFVAANRGYHGRTFGSLSVSGTKKYQEPFVPLLEGVTHVPFNNLDALDEALNDQVAAVILEPIQGEAGIYVPAGDYLSQVRELCDAHGVLLILDEVQTGFRTGKPFAYQHFGVVPDMLCLSKGIANGFPFGVTAIAGAIAEKIPTGSHGSTFAGNPLACAAATATLKVAGDPAVQQQVTENGAYFMDRLQALELAEMRSVRGLGLMVAVEMKRPVTPMIKAMQSNGVLAFPAGSLAIRFLPSLLITREQLDEVATVLENAVLSTR